MGGMKAKAEYCVLATTFPDEETASRVARGVLERRLAACAQTFPARSEYWWKGEICRATEVAATFKTRMELYAEAEAYIRSEHPYETPEILALPVAAGLPEYLRWIDGETERGGS